MLYKSDKKNLYKNNKLPTLPIFFFPYTFYAFSWRRLVILILKVALSLHVPAVNTGASGIFFFFFRLELITLKRFLKDNLVGDISVKRLKIESLNF